MSAAEIEIVETFVISKFEMQINSLQSTFLIPLSVACKANRIMKYLYYNKTPAVFVSPPPLPYHTHAQAHFMSMDTCFCRGLDVRRYFCASTP